MYVCNSGTSSGSIRSKWIWYSQLAWTEGRTTVTCRTVQWRNASAEVSRWCTGSAVRALVCGCVTV